MYTQQFKISYSVYSLKVQADIILQSLSLATPVGVSDEPVVVSSRRSSP